MFYSYTTIIAFQRMKMESVLPQKLLLLLGCSKPRLISSCAPIVSKMISSARR